MRTASIVLAKLNVLGELLHLFVALLIISGCITLCSPRSDEHAILLRLVRITYELSAGIINVYIVMWVCCGSVALIGQLRNK